MNEDLSLIVLACYGGLIFLGAYIYKEIRDYKERRRQPYLPLTSEQHAATQKELVKI